MTRTAGTSGSHEYEEAFDGELDRDGRDQEAHQARRDVDPGVAEHAAQPLGRSQRCEGRETYQETEDAQDPKSKADRVRVP